MNTNEVIEWLKSNECEFFTVSNTIKDNTKVFEWVVNETIEERYKRFIRIMNILPKKEYYIKAKRSYTQTIGLFFTSFTN